MHTVWILMLLLLGSTQAQAPVIEWDKTIGGNSWDSLKIVRLTTDGGCILGGSSWSPISGDKTEAEKGGNDYWIVKLAANGTKEWDKTIGSANGPEYFSDIRQTSDGGYILGGTSASGISGDKTEESKGSFDYWIVKLAANGNIEWDKTLGGNADDLLKCLQQTSDGGYVLGGYSNTDINGDKTVASKGLYDYWIVKLDANGNKVWDKAIGSNSDDYLRYLQLTTDGGYLLGGSVYAGISGDKSEASKGDSDYWIVKLDANGNKVWDKSLGSSGMDDLFALQQTSDEGYILGGASASGISGDKTEANKGYEDYWIVKLDANGTKVWDKTIGGSDSDKFSALQQTSDGGYILGGASASGISGDKTEANKGYEDYWIVKLDANGNMVWNKALGGSDTDYLFSLQQTSDGRYILGGVSMSSMNGDKTEANRGDSDFWLVKLGPEATTTRQPSVPGQLIQLYPNPTSVHLTVVTPQPGTYLLQNLLGQPVLQGTLPLGRTTLQLEALSAGTYLLRATIGTATEVHKVVKR